MSALIGRQVKETPKDASTVSHQFLLRGGYVRQLSMGIFSLLPLGFRIAKKISDIVRDEMNYLGGQEVLLPVVLPGDLWRESGRYDTVDQALLKFKDRNGKEMLLGMTHEEAVVASVRTEINSYKQLPSMVYQIQTKYRDEARARAGLIRCREFTMKDAYSFHESQEDLERYYDLCHAAYARIFKRLGMNNVVSIQSDAGMMGGKVSHEFMAVTEIGEDTLFFSPDGSYKANREIAKTAIQFVRADAQPLTKVSTPGTKTIADLAGHLNVPSTQTAKAVFYKAATAGGDLLVLAVIRGDIEVNETKLQNHLVAQALTLAPDADVRAAGAVPGFASTLGLDLKKVRVVFDTSAKESSNLVVGANEEDHHFTGFNFDRDVDGSSVEVVDIATAREGDPCPVTGQPLELKRGIEVGNIFQLGTRYSAAMGCNFLDRNGKSKPMIMGCYGIGIGRAISSIIEFSNDQYGPIWPMSVAPFQVHIVALNLNQGDVAEKANQLYRELQKAGLEVLFDDRNEKAGSAFNDADLIGIPLRLILSPKTLADNVVELKTRDKSQSDRVAFDDIVGRATEYVRTESARFSNAAVR